MTTRDSPGHTVFERAIELSSRYAEHSASFERDRRLPTDVVQSLREIGVPRLFVPEELGGQQASVPEALRILERLAYGDGALGWCSMITATTSLQAGFLEPSAAQDLFGDPASIACGVAEPRGLAQREGDRLVVTGTWSWGSASFAADWIGGGCRVATPGSAQPELRFVFVPRERVELVDNWYASGLRATGSCDFQIDSAEVPVAHSCRIGVDPPRFPGTLYRFPALPLLALGVSAVALGLAQRSLDELLALAAGKHYVGSARSLAERPAVRAEYAEMEAALDSAGAWLERAVGDAWRHLDRSKEAVLSLDEQRRLRLAATHAARVAVDLGARAVQIGGGSAIHEQSALQRVARDLQVLGTHGMVARRTWEQFGKLSAEAEAIRRRREAAA